MLDDLSTLTDTRKGIIALIELKVLLAVKSGVDDVGCTGQTAWLSVRL